MKNISILLLIALASYSVSLKGSSAMQDCQMVGSMTQSTNKSHNCAGKVLTKDWQAKWQKFCQKNHATIKTCMTSEDETAGETACGTLSKFTGPDGEIVKVVSTCMEVAGAQHEKNGKSLAMKKKNKKNDGYGKKGSGAGAIQVQAANPVAPMGTASGGHGHGSGQGGAIDPKLFCKEIGHKVQDANKAYNCAGKVITKKEQKRFLNVCEQKHSIIQTCMNGDNEIDAEAACTSLTNMPGKDGKIAKAVSKCLEVQSNHMFCETFGKGIQAMHQKAMCLGVLPTEADKKLFMTTCMAHVDDVEQCVDNLESESCQKFEAMTDAGVKRVVDAVGNCLKANTDFDWGAHAENMINQSGSTNGAPVVTPAAPVVTPAAPVVTPAAPVVTPAAPVVTPAAPVVTPAAPTPLKKQIKQQAWTVPE